MTVEKMAAFLAKRQGVDFEAIEAKKGQAVYAEEYM